VLDEKLLYVVLGKKIRSLREATQGERGSMTQGELAGAVHLERTSITNLERGTQKVPLHVLYRVCRVLHVKIDDVLPSYEEVNPLAPSTKLDLNRAAEAAASADKPLLSKLLGGLNLESRQHGDDDDN
jgi:DNA-binding XRE family transcriptional regulator